MRTIDAGMILLGVLIELFLCVIAFDAFRLVAFKWHQQMNFFGMTIQFVFGQKCKATCVATANEKRIDLDQLHWHHTWYVELT